MGLIKTELTEQIGTITMNNPAKRNVLSQSMVDEMIDAIELLNRGKARVIILRGGDGMGVWSAGHDVNELPRPGRDPLSYNDPLVRLLRQVQTTPQPVIAMIGGSVWGGACDLALSCDILIAGESASICMTPAKIGVPYNVSGILHFINMMSVNIAKEMFFTASPITAGRACELGIFNHVVPDGELVSFTMEMARKIAANSPLAIAAIKEQIRLLAAAHPLSPNTFERVQGLRRMVYDSKDYAEGIAAFLDRRVPCFSGE